MYFYHDLRLFAHYLFKLSTLFLGRPLDAAFSVLTLNTSCVLKSVSFPFKKNLADIDGTEALKILKVIFF